MPAQESIEHGDERTPLLKERKNVTVPTPLPTGQIFSLLLLMIAEPVMSMSILPYINEFVSQLPNIGGDEKKVGYYAGIIMSLFYIGQATTVFHWGRLSDIIGRKPVLLSGTLGTILATILFGLSRSFWALAASRFLAGALNGNVGVMKSMIAEMTDDTNIAQAFSFVPLAWAIGAAIGPYMGGFLSRPHDRWPVVFGHSFWSQYPYFLPCAAACIYALVSLLVASVCLKETAPSKDLRESKGEPNSHDVERNNHDERGQQNPPLRALLTRPVLLVISNYGALAFLETCNWIFLSLVYTTPIKLGGLGFDPAHMGICLGVWGILRGIIQFTVFHRMLDYLGLRSTFVALISGLIPSTLLFAINGTYAQHGGSELVLWGLVLIQMLCTIGVCMAYGCTFIYLKSAAPSSMLGATNGLAQTVASIQRAIAPAIAASLFSFSLENNIMGGYGVFYLLTLCSIAALWLAFQLPRADKW